MSRKSIFREGAASQALNMVIFEDAEQLGLEGQGEGRDLIQKERSAVSQFNVPGSGFGGAGERARARCRRAPIR